MEKSITFQNAKIHRLWHWNMGVWVCVCVCGGVGGWVGGGCVCVCVCVCGGGGGGGGGGGATDLLLQTLSALPFRQGKHTRLINTSTDKMKEVIQ